MNTPAPQRAALGLWDMISLIIGIVIGTTIFKSSPAILCAAGGPWLGLSLWVAGGILTVMGVLCYAELSSTYPGVGGEYDYLTRAYGRGMGFAFGWAQLAVIRTSNIGNMAFVFGDFAAALQGSRPETASKTSVSYALAAIVVISLLNLLGVVFGTVTQHVLTWTKVLGLGGILFAGLWGGSSVAWTPAEPGPLPSWAAVGFAMILVMYAFGGWNDATLVAAEVRHRERELPLALLLGTGAITVIYLAVNVAYLRGLGFDGATRSTAIAADVLAPWFGAVGVKLMALLVMISALGSLNGLVFTGARVYAEVGRDYPALGWLRRRDGAAGSSLAAGVLQALISCAMVVLLGTEWGHEAIDRSALAVGLSATDWPRYGGGFELLVIAAAPVFWLFFLLTGCAVLVLRFTDRAVARPFLVPWYPVPPLIFCATCVAMMYAAVNYAGTLTCLGFLLLLAGLPLLLLSRRSTILIDRKENSR